jgi:hypothetical protein
MLIPYLIFFELLLIVLFVDFLEDILEATIIFLQDSILSGQVQRINSRKGEFEAAMSKLFNTLISIVHSKTYTTFSFEFIDLVFLFSSVFSSEDNLKGSRLVDCEICGSILISESMSSDDNRLFPSWNKSWDVLDDNRFSENCSIQDISDSSIWTFPHFL